MEYGLNKGQYTSNAGIDLPQLQITVADNNNNNNNNIIIIIIIIY